MRAQSESFKRLAVGIAATKQGPGPAVSMAPFGMDDVENVLSEIMALQEGNEYLREALTTIGEVTSDHWSVAVARQALAGKEKG